MKFAGFGFGGLPPLRSSSLIFWKARFTGSMSGWGFRVYGKEFLEFPTLVFSIGWLEVCIRNYVIRGTAEL